ATIVFASLFSIIVNVSDGAKAVPREYIEVARSFRSDRWRTTLEIVLPAATPYFLAGLRLAAGRALIGAVVAEFFTAIGGLAHLPSQRGLRRRAAARGFRRRLRAFGQLEYAAFPALVSPRRANGLNRCQPTRMSKPLSAIGARVSSPMACRSPISRRSRPRL